MEESVLSRALTNMFINRISNISRRTIFIYSNFTAIDEIQRILDNWAHEGHIKILKPIDECEDMEPCIRLLRAIPLPK